MSPSPLDLLGTWAMARTIDDRSAGERLTVDGTLELSPDDGGVAWHEAGTLSRPGQRDVAVTRTLRVVRRDGAGDGPEQAVEEGAGWWVVFDHGGDFHPWSPGTAVDHPCGADHYRGLVDAAGLPEQWRITWEVSGPAKDYTMTSVLTRR